jgi:pimeloyl-ACP methyl ester carboxylesterase
MTPEVGDMFRQFRILAKVGEGGMGEVFQARDTKLDRDVALKFLTRVGGAGIEYGARLRREAKSLAALNHPNIVTIYDIGETDGVPFLILEWVPGSALSDPRHRKPFDEGHFHRIATPVAEALAAAHERGIVHRDVKPGNVLVTADGRVKLVDFGLSTLRDADLDRTKTRAVVGTFAYMSPEQANGAEVGPSSDVFSFGVLAYELLSGRRPFAGESVGPLLHAIINQSHPPLSNERPGLSKALIALVDRCLQKTPGERFRNGAELAQELHRVRGVDSPIVVSSSPTTMEPVPKLGTSRPEIRFCTTADGVRIAYSVVGTGPLLVRVLGHFTHLEMEWDWPALRLLWEGLAERHTVVRYDGRGIGLSDRWPEAFTEETRQLDLDAVLNAVQAEKAALLGISEGGWTAAVYANAHPERISHLILYGAYSRGARARPGYDRDEDAALMTLIRKGWGRDTPVFRQIFTSQFFRPNADPGLIAHFNEMQRVSADPETAARYEESCHAREDGREIFSQVRAPTLVIHGRDDQVINFEEGRRLAALIPGAHLVALPSGSHYFPADRTVNALVVDTIDRFTS